MTPIKINKPDLSKPPLPAMRSHQQAEPLILNFPQPPPAVEVIDTEERLLEIFGRPDFKFKQTYADAKIPSPYWRMVRILHGTAAGQQVCIIDDIDQHDPDDLLNFLDDPSYSDVSI